MELAAVKRAYRRYAPVYDVVFGLVLRAGRKRATARANALPGTRVLEVGVGTGLSLADYRGDKRIVGIDVSAEMLDRARHRINGHRAPQVEALLEMDAEHLTFDNDSFDIVVAMYVASVVPSPARLMGEMRRVCRPGGDIFVVNHFARDGGLRGRVERLLAPLSTRLGWHPDFTLDTLTAAGAPPMVESRALPPFGLFSLVHYRNDK
ncbi:MAG: methyltransferase domain-containing protein [Hyphomicrobiales bacterium]|nr:methyltransferase domain-containing protein [Hyphomicrobiales bacterium]